MALTDENMSTTMLVQPSGGMNYGNMGGGIFGNDGLWLLLVLLLGGGFGGFGFGGGYGAMMGMGMMDGFGLYPWLNNSQNINDGFRDQQLQTTVTSVRDGISDLSTQLCNGFGNVQLGLANGFNGVNNSIFGAQTAISQQLNANEMASLNRSFAEQTANTQGFTNVQAQLAQNGYNQSTQAADIKYTIATENCADRYEAAQNTQSIITALTAGIQSIKDDLCQDRLDAERRENANLRSELMYARGQASQVDQTAQLRASQLAANTALLNELRSCPIPAQAVYGNQPVFTCSPNNNCGCGCGNNF